MMAAKFVIQAEYLVPVYVRYCVEAETAWEAEKLLSEREGAYPDFWHDATIDHESARDTLISDVTAEYSENDLADLEDGERI